MASLATPLQPSLQLLEHINLNVPHASRDTVSAFFVAIGAAPNPSGSVAGRQLHFNVGVSQTRERRGKKSLTVLTSCTFYHYHRRASI